MPFFWAPASPPPTFILVLSPSPLPVYIWLAESLAEVCGGDTLMPVQGMWLEVMAQESDTPHLGKAPWDSWSLPSHRKRGCRLLL